MAAVEHVLEAFRHGKHVVMVTVEADCFCGPLLAKKAAEAGVVYSLAYGDQPALICDLVDWARAAGFPVVAAGRGHKWLPHFAQSTPETVWGYYGLTPEQARLGGLNPKMFNSFLDGSKPAIETSAVCNATGLTPAPGGLAYPAGSVDEIPTSCGRAAKAACCTTRGRWKWCPRCTRTARRSTTTSASASGSPSRARASTSAAASPSTA
jgi:predicted homoserine dehydrogenase-like protein